MEAPVLKVVFSPLISCIFHFYRIVIEKSAREKTHIAFKIPLVSLGFVPFRLRWMGKAKLHGALEAVSRVAQAAVVHGSKNVRQAPSQPQLSTVSTFGHLKRVAFDLIQGSQFYFTGVLTR